MGRQHTTTVAQGDLLYVCRKQRKNVLVVSCQSTSYIFSTKGIGIVRHEAVLASARKYIILEM